MLFRNITNKYKSAEFFAEQCIQPHHECLFLLLIAHFKSQDWNHGYRKVCLSNTGLKYF